jgi:biotin carboxyl carrier protein
MSIKEKLGFLNINNSLYKTRISSKFKNRIKYQPADPRMILNFIPGTVLEIFVIPGQSVKKGDLLLILDAMKMQNRLKCPMDGRIKSIVVSKGDKVSKGDLLIELDQVITLSLPR